MTEEAIHRYYGSSTIMASVKITTGEETEEKLFKLSDFPVHEKLEKFMEDVKFGIFPLTAFAKPELPPTTTRAPSPECQKEDKQSEQEPGDVENRRILTMQCSLEVRWVDIKFVLDLSICRSLIRKMDSLALEYGSGLR